MAGSRGSNYVLRGGLFVLQMLSSEISRALRFIADPSKRLIDMITPPIANIDIDAFSPVEQGTVAVPRAPEVHFPTKRNPRGAFIRAIPNEEKITIRDIFVVNRVFSCHDSRQKDHESRQT